MMAEEKVSILYEIVDRASAVVSSLRGKIADLGVSLNKGAEEAKKLEEKWESMGAAGQSLAIGAGVVAAGLGAMGVGALKVAGEFESMRASLKTITGSAEAADAALGMITEFAATTPYDLQQCVGAFTKLKSLGIEPTRENLTSFGNTASAMGKDLNQMIEAVADAATGEFERLKEFGIKSKSEGDKVSFTFQGVTTTVGKNSAEITKYLTDIGQTKFGGAMADQMNTLGGQMSNLEDNTTTLARGFGDALLPAVKPIISAISSLISWLANLSPTTKTVIAVIGSVVFTFATLATGIGVVAAALPTIASGMALLGVTMRGLASASGIGLLVTAFTTLGIVVYNNWESIKSNSAAAALVVVDAFKSVMEGIDKLVDKYNAIAKKVPGIPVINLGTDAALEKLNALQKRLDEMAKTKLVQPKSSGSSGPSSGGDVPPTGPTPEQLKAAEKAFKEYSNELLKTHAQTIEKMISEKQYSVDQEIEMLRVLRDSNQLTQDDKLSVIKKINDLTEKSEKTTSSRILKNHEQTINAMITDRTYSVEKEIELLQKLADSHQLIEEDKLKVTEKIQALKLKAVEDANQANINSAIQTAELLRQNGEISTQQERDRIQSLLDSEKFSGQQKEQLKGRIAALDSKLAEEKRFRDQYLFSEEQKEMLANAELRQKGVDTQLQLTSIVLNAARQAGNEKLSIEKQIANGALNYLKKQVTAEVDAMAARWAIEAGARIASSWGFDIGAWGLLAAAAAASGGIRSALSGIQLAEGGIVMPRPGGVQATIGEAGQAEAVIPLDSPTAKQMLGGGGDRVERIILEADGVRVLAKAVYRQQQYLARTGQIGSGLT